MLPIASKSSHPIVLQSPIKLQKPQNPSSQHISGKLDQYSDEPRFGRRKLGFFTASALLSFGNLRLCPAALAEDETEEGVIGTIKSLFDPNEKTKSGAVLPKAYLKSARDVVKNLRESLKEDPKDGAKFRRSADAAKESIREYLSSWRGQQNVAAQESYVELEKAIKSLANFYSKAGPSGVLPEEIKSEILNDLARAEEFL